jgi:hypothetical protein
MKWKKDGDSRQKLRKQLEKLKWAVCKGQLAQTLTFMPNA